MSARVSRSVVGDAARGSLAAQQLLERISSGKAGPNDLLARMRQAVGVESPAFADGFAADLVKRIRRLAALAESEGSQ